MWQDPLKTTPKQMKMTRYSVQSWEVLSCELAKGDGIESGPQGLRFTGECGHEALQTTKVQ